ncbi:hypothetical protein B0G82_7812 [Paraburkholderia sp. BL17N1]|nr:hypothetical protein B0G82_7812 [Paraburkholderia sp. BL17N1]
MNHDSTVFVGLDVHKESITVAYAIDMGDVELLGKIGTLKADIDRLCKRQLELALFDPAEEQIVALAEVEPPLAEGVEARAEQGGARAEQADEIEQWIHAGLDAT